MIMQILYHHFSLLAFLIISSEFLKSEKVKC